MKKNKWYTISVFIIMCVLLNLAGKCVAGQLRLPLWLDSLGTVAATYVCGPVCGVIVGVTLNILYSIIYSWTYACYAIVSVSIAVIAGICISKDYMKTLLGALTSSFYIALVSCVISMIFNYMFFNGYTNNIWGDGVVESLLGIGFNDLLSHIAGQFYIDFPDKIITVLALYIFVRYDKGKNRFDKRIMTVCIYIGIAAMAAVQLIEAGTPKCVYASSDNIRNNQNNIEETPDYNTYLQTVYGRENGIPGGRANDIAQTNDGILWIGTYGGLYRYNGTEFKWVDEYASVKTVNCLYKDEEGRLWIGTNDGGVSIMIDETIINVVSEKEGLSADSVKCITQGSDGDYYIGTTGAMSVVSLAGGLTVKSYIDDIKYAVSADSDKNGNIAVVSDNGQLSIVKNAAVISEYSASDGGRYTTCSFDDAGMLYVGTSKGNIDKYNINNNAYVLTESISCNELNNIKEIYFVDNTLTENATLFVCADNGIGYYDSKNQFINIDTGSFNNSIDHMTADYQGNLWFTSSRLGLLRLSRSAFTHLNYEYNDENLVVNTVTM
ncbi:MAG: two-component regulator propeller domain-containing protein [Lachnospira sp.]|nr:two-component regulator propeller domain-containing protein [Lachnospira sp.]